MRSWKPTATSVSRGMPDASATSPIGRPPLRPQAAKGAARSESRERSLRPLRPLGARRTADEVLPLAAGAGFRLGRGGRVGPGEVEERLARAELRLCGEVEDAVGVA